MIVEMAKTFVVARRADRENLLRALRRLGVLHVQPVDPDRAAPDADTADLLDRLRRVIQILEGAIPQGAAPNLSAIEAADQVLRIQRTSADRTNRLTALYRQIERLAPWGNVRMGQFQALREAGIEPRFLAVPTNALDQVRAECVQPLGPWDAKRTLVAVVHRGGEIEAPDGAEDVPLPVRDRPSVQAEAKEIDAALKADAAELGRLANSLDAVRREQSRLEAHAEWVATTRSALEDEALFALQGWVPAAEADSLTARIAEEGVDAAVETAPPDADEAPPTLIQYPGWARPMKGLFDVLGTVPGYREFDVAAAFMMALPIFAAIMICDLGYGLVYTVLPIVFYKHLKAAGAELIAQLVLVIGLMAMVWGVLITSFFGFDIHDLVASVPGIGPAFADGPLISVDMQKEHMEWLMWLSILIGAIHLTAAHLWRGLRQWPSLKMVGEVGWAVLFWGVYGLANTLLLKTPFTTVYWYLLIGGGALAILFNSPSRNIFKAVGLGIANFPLAAIGAFGDTMSYLRLMAIGLAGAALAVAFNDMASGVPWYGAIPILILGHGLNVVLSVLSLLAHGVRLNMLEFSSNLGMEWSGHAYEPFSERSLEES